MSLELARELVNEHSIHKMLLVGVATIMADHPASKALDGMLTGNIMYRAMLMGDKGYDICVRDMLRTDVYGSTYSPEALIGIIYKLPESAMAAKGEEIRAEYDKLMQILGEGLDELESANCVGDVVLGRTVDCNFVRLYCEGACDVNILLDAHLYRRYSLRLRRRNPRMTSAEVLRAVFCMRMIYQEREFDMQMPLSIPQEALDYLRRSVGVNFELFSSPLTARTPEFCSAFLRTDAAFGSQGPVEMYRPAISAPMSYEAFISVLTTDPLKIGVTLQHLLNNCEYPVMITLLHMEHSKPEYGMSLVDIVRSLDCEHRMETTIPSNHYALLPCDYYDYGEGVVPGKVSCSKALHIAMIQNELAAKYWPIDKQTLIGLVECLKVPSAHIEFA